MRLLALLFVVTLSACSETVRLGEWMSAGPQRQAQEALEPFMTIGDIEPDSPTDRMLKLRPIADHIAESMGWEPGRVQVRIARSVPEITAMMSDGLIDIYIDSIYPVLLVGLGSGSKVLLESPVDGSRSYNSVIIASIDGDVREVSDLVGKIVGLQEFYSTSGYLLPAAELIGEGYQLEYTAGRTAPASDRIGFFFSGDEENSLSMLQQGVIDAGAMSGLDWSRLPEEIRNEFIVIATTDSVPRKMLSVRKGFDAELIEPLSQALFNITDEQRSQMFADTGWSWAFVPLDEQSRSGIERTRRMISMTNEIIVQ